MPILDALWVPVMGIYVAVLIFFLAFGLNLLYMTWLAAHRPPRHASPPPLADYPFVTVQLPVFNEMYVIERLVQAACVLDWPTDRLEIQILDDSTDETQFIAARLVRQFRERGLQINHLRREDRQGFKAGALEAGLAQARGEYIAVFDADFVPPREFLKQTIPYFAFERVAFVQARWGHLNRSFSLLTEFQSVVIDAHFCVDQVARNRGGYFMNFNGTAGVWRRAAIVDAGGWEHDTLAEDLDLSYRAQLRGWEAVYLPDLVAYAELPPTVSAYRSQQRRWAAGSFACALKLLPSVLRAPLPSGVKLQATLHLLGYVSHLCLLTMFLLQPLLLYYSIRFPMHSPFMGVSIAWLVIALVPTIAPGTYLAYSQWRANGRLIPRLPYIFGASVMGAAIMLTVVSAIIGVLYGKQAVFVRTPKYGIGQGTDAWDGKRYSLGVDPVIAIEVLLACYSVGTLAYAATLQNWGSVSYTGYFFTGLVFMIWSTFVQLNIPLLPRALPSSPFGNREP